MSVAHIDFLVEEPSAEAALRALLPRMLGPVAFSVYQHPCKDDLLTRLPDRLRGYQAWLPADRRVVVLVDRDDEDCLTLKARLEQMAHNARLTTRANQTSTRPAQVINRVVVEELEAWFFGDWEAVRAAYPNVNPNVPKQAKYRAPDAIGGGTWEALERLLQKAGYFKTGLRKLEVARAVAEQMAPERNTSPSFRAFRLALEALVQRAAPTAAQR